MDVWMNGWMDGWMDGRFEFDHKAACRASHQIIQASASEGLAQGPYVAPRELFEPATLRF